MQSLKNKWWIGKVSYVDLATYDGMDMYEGNQAHLRAFLKGIKYSHESELRVVTMNFVAPGCLNPDGLPQTEKQRKGFKDASNGPGIYVKANLSTLIDELRVAPRASESHRARIELFLEKAGIRIPVKRSEIPP